MISEVSRVCKKGSGYVLISVPNLGYIKHIWSLIRGQQPMTGSNNTDISKWAVEGWDGHHLHYFTKKGLSDLLSLYNLIPLKWSSDGKYCKIQKNH